MIFWGQSHGIVVITKTEEGARGVLGPKNGVEPDPIINIISDTLSEHFHCNFDCVSISHGNFCDLSLSSVSTIEVTMEGARRWPYCWVSFEFHKLSNFVLLISVISMDVLKVICGTIAQLGAFRLKDVGNLESIISWLNDKQRCSDEWEHILG